MLNVAALLVLLALTLLAVRAYTRASPALMARRLRLGGGVAAGAAAGYLTFRGNFALALPLFSFAGWLIWGHHVPWARGQAAPKAGQASTVTTDTLEMELDHASGAMRGRVLKGFFAGRDLDRMRPVELAHLWQDCRFADPQSATLIEAYLDRLHPTWREDLARAEADAPKGPDGRMARSEALEILGLKDGATAEDIREAHKKLMLKLHPDRGGSTYLAAKINEAKDVALGAAPGGR
ncbi:MAG: DnaJ domain-containing protein [Hyphomicrobiaceae bacterium]